MRLRLKTLGVSSSPSSSSTVSFRLNLRWDLNVLLVNRVTCHFQVTHRVESRRGAVPVARFPSPLIKPDVPISSIRLSDRLHARPTQVSAGPSSSGGRPAIRTQP